MGHIDPARARRFLGQSTAASQHSTRSIGRQASAPSCVAPHLRSLKIRIARRLESPANGGPICPQNPL